ncbi:MAG: energy-coupling factor transport system permease protein [Thermomicrobiales bacterium]|nr:energy-coupling factor transport system permease protein [Thermomicrobiales bacterium]
MSGRLGSGLDPRAWLAWGAAASLPPLLGRNPFPLIATLFVVVGVRAAWSGRATRVSSWGGIVRLAAVFAAVGVLFNVLTVRTGDRVLAEVPESVPILAGPVTLNALVFGILSGLALLILVLVGTTVGALLDWPAALRLLPERLTTVAVAGSVAFAFIPQTAVAFREIREAQAARGHRFRGARDLIPLLVPLLTGGLERAVTLAEALESRAFGAPVTTHPTHGRAWSLATAGGLAAMALAGYLLAVGRVTGAGLALATAGIALLVATRRGTSHGPSRSRFRSPVWSRADTLTLGGAVVAGLATLAAVALDPASLRYEPYPDLLAPHVNLALILAQTALLAPAFLVDVAIEAEP